MGRHRTLEATCRVLCSDHITLTYPQSIPQRAQARGVTVIRATFAIPTVLRLINAAFPLLSLYFHLNDLLELADDAEANGAKTKRFREKMSNRRSASAVADQDSTSALDGAIVGASKSKKQSSVVSPADTPPHQSTDRESRSLPASSQQTSAANILSASAKQVSALSPTSKLAGSIAITALSIFIFVLTVISAHRNATFICDPADDVLKRCVLSFNTLNPFHDTSQCLCVAYHGDCESTPNHQGIGAIGDGEGALRKLQ